MKKIAYLIGISVLITLTTSCEKWFDVSPKSQVKQETLFADENGFKTAMFGVYTLMNGNSLYGFNLTAGMMDARAQYYTITNNYSSNYSASIFDYSESRMKTSISSIWTNMYKAIMNCNNLLENIDGKKIVFDKNNYDLIKGEVLGLRAYLHFDLLRMFAPSFTVGSEQAAIPYVNKVQREPFNQLTNAQVIAHILEDCNKSRAALLNSDPIVNNNTSNDIFLADRHQRMNYYAVTALMARVALWSGDKTNAAKYAKEIIDSKKFETQKPVFSLYSDILKEMSNNYFDENSDNQALIVKQDRRGIIYEVAEYLNYDTRINTFLRLKNGSVEDEVSNSGIYLLQKYTSVNEISLIRLSEMYYILAECTEDEATALGYLNVIRNSYGIPSSFDLKPDNATLSNAIFMEYRKTMIGEGQLFYYIKRNDYTTIPFYSGDKTARAAYTFALPDDEFEFGNMINN